MRIAITGGPKTGKTTLAKELGNVRSTDDLMATTDWSGASAEAAKWIAQGQSLEGVTVPRALRKALDASPDKPVDKVIWLGTPHANLSPGQRAMAKGCETVFREIEPELRRRGVEIERR